MGQKIGEYISNKNMNRLKDIDFHDFIEMVQAGLHDEEIAQELGVHKNYIEKLKYDINRDY